MTVLPFGRSGVVAASMLGLGRALGETVAMLVIISASASPGKWSLFDGGYTFASKIASAASEFTEPLPTGAYISAGFVLFVLTFLVNAAARWSAVGRSTDEPLGTLIRPIKMATPRRISIGRRIKNGVAATLFLISFMIAMVPLVWLLWVVIERGWHAIFSVDWWSHSLRGVMPEQFAGGVYHALYGTLIQAGPPLYSRCRWAS